jgi:hypothetical protein
MELWESWPQREPFAHPVYLEAFLGENQEAVCAIQTSETGAVLFPLILRPVSSAAWATKGEYRDATSPYGYGGAFFWGEVDELCFWDSFDEWAEECNIVSLFARLSLFGNSILPFRGTKRYVMDNIVRSLELDEEAMWMDYEHKVRKNVNKSTRSDVKVEWDMDGERLIDFQKIYASTMVRREASEGFFFPDSFFEDLIKGCPDCIAFVHAVREGRVISTECILIGAEYCYSFLGGTDQESFDLRPNDLLKHEIIRWCRLEGKKSFVLGGGLAPDDGLLKYKNSFAPKDGRLGFYVGERIYDDEANKALLSLRKATAPAWEPKSAFFPAYRSP